jgi:hypothetical protein
MVHNDNPTSSGFSSMVSVPVDVQVTLAEEVDEAVFPAIRSFPAAPVVGATDAQPVGG